MMGDKIDRLLIALLAFFLLACGENHSSSVGTKHELRHVDNDTCVALSEDRNNVVKFVPDTSVCDVSLLSYISVEREFGDIMGDSINIKYGYENYYFSNIDTSEFLKVAFTPGGVRNSFDFFVVSKVDYRPVYRKLYFTNCPVFYTENNIRLGLALNEVIKIKGSEFIETKIEDFRICTYVISDRNSPFLIKYNMPMYVAVFKFRNDILVEYEFGFPAP